MTQGNLNPPARRYITRMEGPNHRGWYVRVGMSTNGANKNKKVHQKLFSDGVYGGKMKALRAAKAYRDKELKRMNLVIHKKHKGSERSQWGAGYCRSFDLRRANYVWVAYWQHHGKQIRQQFSENKYGAVKAEKMARQVSKAMRKLIMEAQTG